LIVISLSSSGPDCLQSTVMKSQIVMKSWVFVTSSGHLSVYNIPLNIFKHTRLFPLHIVSVPVSVSVVTIHGCTSASLGQLLGARSSSIPGMGQDVPLHGHPSSAAGDRARWPGGPGRYLAINPLTSSGIISKRNILILIVVPHLGDVSSRTAGIHALWLCLEVVLVPSTSSVLECSTLSRGGIVEPLFHRSITEARVGILATVGFIRFSHIIIIIVMYRKSNWRILIIVVRTPASLLPTSHLLGEPDVTDPVWYEGDEVDPGPNLVSSSTGDTAGWPGCPVGHCTHVPPSPRLLVLASSLLLLLLLLG